LSAGGAELSRARRADGGAPADPVFCNAGHREMVSAGAAAGMAAAFGAPIGGVLFALEEACSVWSKKTAWRCLLCAAVAVFCMGQITSTGGGLLQLRGIYAPSPRQWLWQLPLVAVVAAAGALLGGAFNVLRRRAQGLRAPRTSHLLRLLE
jgi:chloride channel 7